MSRFKTKLCSYFMDSSGSFCPHGAMCQFAHGVAELRVPGRPGEPSRPAPPETLLEAREALLPAPQMQLQQLQAQQLALAQQQAMLASQQQAILAAQQAAAAAAVAAAGDGSGGGGGSPHGLDLHMLRGSK